MNARHLIRSVAVLVAVTASISIASPSLSAQAPDPAAKRLASIVSVVVDEYGKAIDSKGHLISDEEYQETTGFLVDAKQVAQRLNGSYAAAARATLDTLAQAAAERRPPAALQEIQARFVKALGTAGAMDLPNAPLDTTLGHALFSENCSSCHGARGLGDGPMAHGLATPPPAIGDSVKVPALAATSMFNVVSVGVRNTAMPAFAMTLTPQQRWNVINYVYTSLRHQPLALPAPADATRTDADQAAYSVGALLDSALDFAKRGQVAEAGDRAFDAYIAFEPLEAPARAREPDLVSRMERTFADFKGAVRRRDMRAAQDARDAILHGLPRVVDLTRPSDTSAWTAFWQSFLIIVREGFEAILVIGAVVAFLIKMGHRERLRSIWTGVVLALLASGVTAVLIKTIFTAIPASQEIVEATSLLIAVVVLFSVSYWLISKVEAAKWQQFIREKVTNALEHGGGGALALVAFLAVYREGAETALFYQALFSEGVHLALPLSLGIICGFVVLAIIFTLFYRYGVKIPLRPFFAVTSVLLYYMAFVFAGKGIRELQEGNVMSITPVAHVPSWDAFGIFPTVETLTAQGILLALFVFALLKTFMPRGEAAER